MSQEMLVHILAGTAHVPKKGNAYLAGTVHVAKEVQTIQRFLLEPYMWEKRYEPNSGTVHVAKCSSAIFMILFAPI